MLDVSANDEMLEGYRDGFNPDSPEPSANRSESYRHGFACGRADRAGRPMGRADAVRARAVAAMDADAAR